MDKTIIENLKNITEQDHKYLAQLIAKHYETSSIQFIDSVKDTIKTMDAFQKEIRNNSESIKDMANKWKKVFALFNNDYIALGLFAEEHKVKSYIASGFVTFNAEFYDVVVTNRDNAYEEVSGAIDGCDINSDTGFGSGTTNDVSVDDIETRFTLEPFSKIQNDYCPQPVESKQKA